MEYLLKIENLSAGILKGQNLGVKQGARTLIRGKNGSGKTTLVQAIMGNPDYTVTSGKIVFDRIDITNMPTSERARMGIFLGGQNVPEIPGLSIMTFLKHSLTANNSYVSMGEFLERLKAAQHRLDIPDAWLGRGVNVGFSGGEKKRLMFLHLLLLNPKMAILDEPDSGADEVTRKLLGELIDEMTGTTFVVISHQDVYFTITETVNIVTT